MIWDQCKMVHEQVFKGFHYVEDEIQFGKIEHWQVPPDADRVDGDCDEFALACRHMLDEVGVKTRLVLCRTELGEGHLVCAAGNFILDNRERKVRTKQYMERRGYRWLAVSGARRGDPWHRVGD